jgi:putative PIN family toxin of toxin-antitoxin system
MLHAVIDSTALVSAFLTQRGVAAELLRHARAGALLLSLSDDILEETERVLLTYPHIRDRYPYEDQAVTAFCEELRRAASLVTDLPHVLVVIRDPKDDMVIATALKAQATHIVTRDLDLLSLEAHEGITILSPEAFMAILRERAQRTNDA